MSNTWGAIVVYPNCTTTWLSSVQTGNASYDPTGCMGVFISGARFYQVTLLYLLPQMVSGYALQRKITLKFFHTTVKTRRKRGSKSIQSDIPTLDILQCQQCYCIEHSRKCASNISDALQFLRRGSATNQEQSVGFSGGIRSCAHLLSHHELRCSCVVQCCAHEDGLVQEA